MKNWFSLPNVLTAIALVALILLLPVAMYYLEWWYNYWSVVR